MDKLEKTLTLIERTMECNYRGAWDLSPPNSHFDSWRAFPTPMISMMLEGKAEVSLKRKRGGATLWSEGDVICLPPAIPRLVRVLSQRNIHYYGVAVSFNILHGIDPLSLFDIPVIYTGDEAKSLGLTLKEIMNSKLIENPFKRAASRNALSTKLLYQLLEPANMLPGMSRRLNDLGRLTAAVNHLIKNYTERPDIDYLARLSCLSKSRFHVVFKEALGFTPYEFVKHQRLDKAVTMLASDKLSIAEIGQALGWNDQFHFSRTFKSFFGFSPRDYRQNNIHAL